MGRAAKLGFEAVAKLKAAATNIDIIGDVRGRGFFIGIELVADKKTKEPLSSDKVGFVLGDLLNAGVTCVPAGRYHNVIRYMPSLVITKNYFDKATDILIEICKKH
jgi:4-aminobutyrate aminotransferase